MRDLVRLERRDKTDIQLLVNLMGDLVSLVFKLFNLLGILLQVPEIIGEVHKAVGCKHQHCREAVKMVKKDVILGNYPFLETHNNRCYFTSCK